jgi:hypothetical protein
MEVGGRKALVEGGFDIKLTIAELPAPAEVCSFREAKDQGMPVRVAA